MSTLPRSNPDCNKDTEQRIYALFNGAGSLIGIVDNIDSMRRIAWEYANKYAYTQLLLKEPTTLEHPFGENIPLTMGKGKNGWYKDLYAKKIPIHKTLRTDQVYSLFNCEGGIITVLDNMDDVQQTASEYVNEAPTTRLLLDRRVSIVEKIIWLTMKQTDNINDTWMQDLYVTQESLNTLLLDD